MATAPRIRNSATTLEEFLRMPGIDDEPYLEFINGKIEAKVSPQKKHSLLQGEFHDAFNRFARPKRLGRAFIELRCTFAGRSILPDVTFLLKENILLDDQGEPIDETPVPPDIHVEIISPDKKVKKSLDKLVHSTSNGCSLGILVHPYRKTVDVVRPGLPPLRLPHDGAISGEPVLQGFSLAVGEVFGWLKLAF